MKKFVFGAVLSFGLIITPAFASAAALTDAQVQSIVSLLGAFGADSATIASVRAVLTGNSTAPAPTPSPEPAPSPDPSSSSVSEAWCHTFNRNLYLGSGGAKSAYLSEEVAALQIALTKEGYSIDRTEQLGGSVFGKSTRSAVVDYQKRNGILASGNVGIATRSKLNEKYGCQTQTSVRKSFPTFTVVPTSPSLPATNARLYRFKITADAAGDIDWTKISFKIKSSVPITKMYLADETNGDSIILNYAVQSVSSTDTSIVPFDLTKDTAALSNIQTIAAGSTRLYSLFGTVANFAAGSELVISLASDSAPAAKTANALVAGNIVWSDWSDTSDHAANPLGSATTDWTNGYELKDFSNVRVRYSSISAVPTIDSFSALPASVYSGQVTNLSWTTSNTTSCTGSISGLSGLNGNTVTPVITSAQTYILTCSGPGGTTSKSITVNVNPGIPPTTPAPSLNLTAASGGVSSDTALTVAPGSTFSISGTPQNLSGLNYFTDYTRAWFFDPLLNNVCTNNGAGNALWQMTCTPTASGSANVRVDIYRNGQTYSSNTVRITVAPSVPAVTPAISVGIEGTQPATGDSVTFSWSANYAAEYLSAYLLDITGASIASRALATSSAGNARITFPAQMPFGQYRVMVCDQNPTRTAYCGKSNLFSVSAPTPGVTLPPTVDFTVNGYASGPVQVQQTLSFGQVATPSVSLSWCKESQSSCSRASSVPTTCTVTSPDGRILSTAKNSLTDANFSWVTDMPARAGSYAVSCTSQGGTTRKEVAVTIIPPAAPGSNFQIDPITSQTISPGHELSFKITASGAEPGTVAFSAANLPVGAAVYRFGDVSMNGALNSMDTVYVMQYASSTRSLSAAQKLLGDVNEDGAVTSEDAQAISRILVFLDKAKNAAVFSWTPAATQAGTYTFTITATAGTTAVTKEVTITVAGSTSVSAVRQLASVSEAFNAGNPNSPSQRGLEYSWERDLQIGSPYAEDVRALQTALKLEGLYSGEETGGFYSQTYQAVTQFQQKYGIKPTGFVGLQTRERLNALY